MMPGTFENNLLCDENEELSTPVTTLKDALPISELLKNRQTEFEVQPDEGDESITEDTVPESCFNFDKLEKVINLDVINVEDSEDGTPFDKYRRKMQNLREDGKVKKYIVRPGVGSLVPEKSVVYLRYQAYFEYAEVPFDSTLWQCSTEGDLPIPINLAKGQLLSGLYEAVLSMRKGEKAEFLIHPDLAYGKFGCPPRIPPEATVLFIVEVDRFIECGDAFDDDDVDIYDRKEFSKVFKIAKGHYMLGNDLFKNSNYKAAVAKYRLVINMMHNARLNNEEEEMERNHFLIKNYTNSMICYKHLKHYKRICIMAQEATRVDEKKVFQNSKLLYFWGYAKMMLGDLPGAKKHLLAAQKLRPQSVEIGSALKDLEKKKSDAFVQEKIMMQKAFGYWTPAEVKITEVDEAEEKFKNAVSNELRKFKDDPNRDNLVIKHHNFTTKEEKLYLQVAKELGLYSRVVDEEKRIIHIKKPTEN